MLSGVEGGRKAAKAPLLDAGKNLDAVVREFAEPLDAHKLRLNRLVGDYVTLQQAKARAAEAARLKELAEIERQKQAALAQASSHEEREKIHEQFHRDIACASAGPVTPKPRGLAVKADIEFEVVDMRSFVAAHWNFVRQPVAIDRVAVKEAIRSGLHVVGVQWKEVVKASVRGNAGKEIEV